MGWIADIRAVLGDVDELRRLRALPTRVTELEQRVQTLEARLLEPWPADLCKACGMRAARYVHTNLNRQAAPVEWRCTACNVSEFRALPQP